jgi:hypothetical protein
LESIYGKGSSSSSGAGSPTAANTPSTISNLGAKFNAAEKLDSETGTTGTSGKNTTSTQSGNSSGNASGSNTTGTTTRRDQVLGFDGNLAQADTSTSSQEYATDAVNPEYTTVSSDKALLQSNLVTDPGFTDVQGFVFLLQAVKETDIIPLIIRRFDSLDQSIDPLQKYSELVTEIQQLQGNLENFEQMLFAAEFVKNGIWPDSAGFTEQKISAIQDQVLHLMTIYVLDVAKTANPEAAAYDIVNSIFKQACNRRICDINHIAYMLATAHHESLMGYWMLERAPENYSPNDPDFSRDAYFFDQRPGKLSYNGVNGNLLAGDQLSAWGVISDADKAVWNGTVYPHSQPEDVKFSARGCDFYKFSGKGLVQVTGRKNYGRYSNLPEMDNVDFVSDPDKVTEFDYAAAILILGIEFGYCNPKSRKLSDYDKIDTNTFDAFNARDIVNGDKQLFPKYANGNPIGTETFGQRIRRLAISYKDGLIQFPGLEESRKIV